MSYDFKIINGDWQIASDGDLAIVEDTDKLVQDVLKLVHFPLGKNKFHPWYGSPLNKTMIGSPMDAEFSSAMASNQLATSLATLQKLQAEQQKTQKVTPFELIAAIKQVSIKQNEVDLRNYLIIIDILTRAMKNVPVTFMINSGS